MCIRDRGGDAFYAFLNGGIDEHIFKIRADVLINAGRIGAADAVVQRNGAAVSYTHLALGGGSFEPGVRLALGAHAVHHVHARQVFVCLLYTSRCV